VKGQQQAHVPMKTFILYRPVQTQYRIKLINSPFVIDSRTLCSSFTVRRHYLRHYQRGKYNRMRKLSSCIFVELYLHVSSFRKNKLCIKTEEDMSIGHWSV